jgi:hypothetical protein
MWLNIISLIVAFSGWAVFLYERFTESPRIKGKIINVISGRWLIHGKELTSFLVYLYITNQHRNSVHILDYELEADFGKGFQNLERVYMIDNSKKWTFLDPKGEEIVIPNFKENLIYKTYKSVQFGEICKGFILFAGNKQLYGINAKKFRVTCLDVFGRRHQFISTPEQFFNLNLLLEMTEIKLPTKNV